MVCGISRMCTTLRRKTVGRQVTLSTDVSRMSISSNNHLVDNFFIGATNGRKLFALITISLLRLCCQATKAISDEGH